jgi:hypothetical protein
MTTTLPELASDQLMQVRELISAQEFRAVTHTIRRRHPELGADKAPRVLEEALKFVATGARFPGCGIRPSAEVDKGWHALILHTAIYARLCAGLGRFVHHHPDAPSCAKAHTDALDKTRELMLAAGFMADPTLWPTGESAKCGPNGDGDCCDTCDPNRDEK